MTSFYIWLSIGIVLMCAEILGTEFFLLFLGISAIVTSIVVLVIQNMDVMSQLTTFSILAIISVCLWYFIHRKDMSKQSEYVPNGGLSAHINKKVEVDSIDSDGTIKIKILDSVYIATSVDDAKLNVGDCVIITGVNGSRLLVKQTN